jgi:glutaminase
VENKLLSEQTTQSISKIFTVEKLSHGLIEMVFQTKSSKNSLKPHQSCFKIQKEQTKQQNNLVTTPTQLPLFAILDYGGST